MNKSSLLFALLGLLAFSSCVSHHELVNFNEAELAAGVPQAINNALEIRIQPDDLLRITVNSISPEAAAPFNIEPVTGQGNNNAGPEVIDLFKGYLVDKDGNIDFPLLGLIPAAGKTLEGLRTDLRQRLTTYLKDPVVGARFLNFRVTVLGEVNTPGVIRVTNSRIAVLDALGFSGDLSDYADRTDVLIIRETGDVRRYHHVNLQSADIFESDFFYLKQNDVVYVKPIRSKTATIADPGQRLVSYGTAALSVATLIIALTRNSGDN